MEKLIRFIGKYIWIFIACYVILYLLNKVLALGGRMEILLLAVVATMVPVLGDYLRDRGKR